MARARGCRWVASILARSSFLQYVRVRAVRTIDEVLEKPSWGYAHVPRTRTASAREGGAFARSFQRIRRRDADALPRLRHLSRHATAGIFPLSRVINERRSLGQRRPTGNPSTTTPAAPPSPADTDAAADTADAPPAASVLCYITYHEYSARENRVDPAPTEFGGNRRTALSLARGDNPNSFSLSFPPSLLSLP